MWAGPSTDCQGETRPRTIVIDEVYATLEAVRRFSATLSSDCCRRARADGHHRALRDPRRRLGARRPAHRLARTRFPDQIDGHRLGVRDPDRLPARARRVLARRVRLARAGGAAQRARALPHRDRRPVDPLRPRALAARRRAPAAPHARLAGLGRRVPRRHPAADRPGGARRRRGRRVPRDRAVAARLRVLGADAHARLGRRSASRARSSS